ncbi:MAG: glycerophosphodiester phosphodiesterase [Actinomycetes bacterium]
MPSTGTAMVVAHRGSSGVRAEHTLAAYEQALTDGADAVECDVRLTRDGVQVCVHDRRVDRTSDGRGVVSSLELSELAELDFASWKARQSDPLLEAAWEEADTDPERGRVLTFERLLELVLDFRAPDGRPVQLQVETKHPTRYGGLVERRLIEVLEEHGCARPLSRSTSRVAVLSYAPTSLRRVHALAPSLPTVLNMDRVPVWYRDGTLPLQVQAAGIALPYVRRFPDVVDRFHARGHRVHVFTADDPADIDLLLELGVDAIISNHPRRVLRRLGRL